jgi:hypothetical protein
MLIENKNVFQKNCVYVCVTQNDEGKKEYSFIFVERVYIYDYLYDYFYC